MFDRALTQRNARRVIALAMVLVAVVAVDSIGQDTERRKRRGRRADRDEIPTRKFDLDTWGQLGKAVKGTDFFEFTHHVKDKKGRRKKVKAYLRVTDETELTADVRIPVEKIEDSSRVMIFGRPIVRDVPDRRGQGRGRKDAQIQNAHVVLTGFIDDHSVRNPKSKHTKLPGHKWCDGTAVKAGGGLLVKFDRTDHRVTLEKGAPVLHRLEIERKKLRSRSYIEVRANELEDLSELPPSVAEKRAGDGKRDPLGVFTARAVVVLDRRSVKKVYPLLWAR